LDLKGPKVVQEIRDLQVLKVIQELKGQLPRQVKQEK
jgi:hypothetical protein